MHTYMYDMTSNNDGSSTVAVFWSLGYSIYLQLCHSKNVKKKIKTNSFHRVTSSAGELHKSYKY